MSWFGHLQARGVRKGSGIMGSWGGFSQSNQAIIVFLAVSVALVSAVARPAGAGDGAGCGELDEIWVGGWNTHNVLRIDAETGQSLGMFVPNGVGGLNRAHHFSFGPDGNFYVASYGTSSVIRYDGHTGEFIEVFIGPGGNGLINAHTVYWHTDGNVLVSSENGDRVNHYDGGNGAYLGAFVQPGEAGLDGPEYIVAGPDGYLYLAAHNAQVLKLDPINGGVVENFVWNDPQTPEDETGGLTWAHGLAFGPDGNLYVSSSQNHRINRYDGGTGEFIDAFVPQGSGSLAFPLGLTFGPDGHLYVASFNNSRILKYNGQTGAFMQTVAFLGGMGLSGPLHLEFFSGPLPPACPTDIDEDDATGASDLAFLLGAWGPNPGHAADFNCDDIVNAFDLALLLGSWGPCI